MLKQHIDSNTILLKRAEDTIVMENFMKMFLFNGDENHEMAGQNKCRNFFIRSVAVDSELAIDKGM